MSQQAVAARENFDIVNSFHKIHDQIKGVDDVIKIDSGSDSNYDEDDYIPRVVKREYYDSSDDGYEVDPDENQDDVLVEDVNEG